MFIFIIGASLIVRVRLALLEWLPLSYRTVDSFLDGREWPDVKSYYNDNLGATSFFEDQWIPFFHSFGKTPYYEGFSFYGASRFLGLLIWYVLFYVFDGLMAEFNVFDF